MSEKLNKLLNVSSGPLADQPPTTAVVGVVRDLLSLRNGFIGFEGALLVLPSVLDQNGAPTSVEAWNAAGWRSKYPEWAGAVVFGFDAFLDQFAVLNGRIVRLNTYTAEVDPHSESLEEWAARLLGDYDFETGWSVARAWQSKNRPLRVGERLVPRTPFVLGGAYEADNVVAVPAGDAIEPIVSLCEQMRDLPDGGQVQLHGWNPDGWVAQ